MCLVKDAKHPIQLVVDLSVQAWNLYDDAFVGETLHKRVWQSLCHYVAVIVIRLAAYVEHRLLDVADFMSQQVNGHHGNGISPLVLRQHVFNVSILCTEVLTETQRLRFQPGLLQLNQYQVFRSVFLLYGCPEVYAEYRQPVAGDVGIFVAARLHFHHVLLQQSGQDGFCYAFVLHEVLEHDVVDGVCNNHTLRFSFLLLNVAAKVATYFEISNKRRCFSLVFFC